MLLALSVLITLGFGTLGALAALRTGSGEAVQGLFPLLFVLLFLSSNALPRNLIETDWFRTIATYNPVSYLLEAIRSLVITGWDGEALALGFGCAGAIAARRPVGVVAGAAVADGAHVSRSSGSSVARAVAWRSIHNVFTNPALILPSLIFPLFFFTAFAGGLSRVSSIPNFDFPPGYTAFQFVFVLIQSSAFAGVFTGFGVARDFEMGFGRRLLLAAPRRSAIVAGYVLSGLVRALFTMAIITVVALIAGMQVDGGGVDLFGLYGLAVLVNLAASLWAVGVALRVRSIQGGPADAGAGVPHAVPRARVPAARPAVGLDPRRRVGEPGHRVPRRRARPDRGPGERRRGGVRDRARADRGVRPVVAARPAQRRGRGRLSPTAASADQSL